jgi:hypothetical protein
MIGFGKGTHPQPRTVRSRSSAGTFWFSDRAAATVLSAVTRELLQQSERGAMRMCRADVPARSGRLFAGNRRLQRRTSP